MNCNFSTPDPAAPRALAATVAEMRREDLRRDARGTLQMAVQCGNFQKSLLILLDNSGPTGYERSKYFQTIMSPKLFALLSVAGAAHIVLSPANLAAAPLSLEILPENTSVSGISSDGSTVLGSTMVYDVEYFQYHNDLPFRWRNSAMEVLQLPASPYGTSYGMANGCSRDGNIVYGGAWPAGPYLWDGTGAVTTLPLPDLPEAADAAWLSGMTADGSVAAGSAWYPNVPGQIVLWRNGTPELLTEGGLGGFKAMSADGRQLVWGDGMGVTRWTEGAGVQTFAFQDANASFWPNAVSPDGSTIVGNAQSNSNGNTYPLMHTVGGGFVPFSAVGIGGSANGVAEFGICVVGEGEGPTSQYAFHWDPVHGLRDLNALLAENGVDLQGYQLIRATGVSDDGDTIVGEINEYDAEHDTSVPRGFVIHGARAFLGVDPTLKVTGLTGSPAEGFQLSWSTLPDRVYRVQWSEDLVSWKPISPEVVAIGAEEAMDLAAGTGRRFWRVQPVCDLTPLPDGLVEITAGAYQMGDTFAEGSASELPVHSVQIASFRIAPTEISKQDWDNVRTWAVDNGYTDLPVGAGKSFDHPVQGISWYAAVKWCNARSEMEGLIPAYYTTTARTVPYRTGTVALTADHVDWTVNGYRLPTEAEWEKAARMGEAGVRFPGGNTINHNSTNYTSDGSTPAYDLANTTGPNPAFNDGTSPYTANVDWTSTNGLFQMVGNVREWCWDRYGSAYYASSSASDPRGSASGSVRVARGGSWSEPASSLRCAARSFVAPSSTADNLGFRVVRSTR